MQTVFVALLVASVLGGILSGLPVMVVLLGMPLVVAALGTAAGAFDPGYLAAFPQRVFGLAGNTLLVAVPLFVVMGLLLERSRTAERMLLVLASLLGGSRRGLVLAVLGVSALIAASTGIIGATVVMLALIGLPAMQRAGIPLPLSSGLVCASGTLGQIVPPSIVLILLGDQLSTTYLEAQHAVGNFAPEPVSIADLFAAALIPGALLVVLYALYVLWRLRSGDSAELPSWSSEPAPDTVVVALFTVFLPPLALIGSVLGSILFGVATPTEAAAVGAAGALLLAAAQHDAERVTQSLIRGCVLLAALAAVALVVLRSTALERVAGIPAASLAMTLVLLLVAGLSLATFLLLRRRVLGPVLLETVQISAMIFGIVIGASMLSLVFRGFEGDVLVSQALAALPGDEHGVLLATLLLIFALGFVLEFVEIIFIVVPLIGPTLLAGDIDPVWLGVLIALNLQTSFLTPPFGFALFYFKSVAPPGLSTLGLYRAIVPFVALQVLALCCVYAFPALATWLPGLMN